MLLLTASAMQRLTVPPSGTEHHIVPSLKASLTRPLTCLALSAAQDNLADPYLSSWLLTRQASQLPRTFMQMSALCFSTNYSAARSAIPRRRALGLHSLLAPDMSDLLSRQGHSGPLSCQGRSCRCLHCADAPAQRTQQPAVPSPAAAA